MFTFKQFVIRQDQTAMKAGTDGVLLGAWCDINGACNILDIGTGTGLIALMCAQRSLDAIVDAIEIDPDASCQARQNIMDSKFRDRISVVNTDFRNYYANSNQKFSHIVSNPPFFTETLGCRDQKRQLARHTLSLPFVELVRGVASMLDKGGKFSVIIPWSEKLDFVRLCALNGLHLYRKTAVVSRDGNDPIRAMLSFSNVLLPLTQNQLIIRDANGNYTTCYKQLTSEFYLKF